MSLVDELEKLSLTLDFLDEGQAREILEYFSKVITDRLHPQIIDVLWRRESKHHVVLVPLVCIDDVGRGQSTIYTVPRDPSPHDRKIGLWAWVYTQGKPLWLERIKTKIADRDLFDTAKPVPIVNKASTEYEEIDPRYFNVFPKTDSIIVIPLATSSRKDVYGILSIEFSESDLLSEQVLDLLNRLSEPLARILYKLDVLRLNHEDTSQAIRLFKEAMLERTFLNPYRSGFIARPFQSDFKVMEDCAARFLEKNGIRAQCYESPGGEGYVLDGIMSQIRSSHFGIADITGHNLNVVLELGAMIQQRKKVLILRRRGDGSEIPFNIRPYNIVDYEVIKQQVFCYSPSDSGPKPFKVVLMRLVQELKRDPNFVLAKPWLPRGQGERRVGEPRARARSGQKPPAAPPS